MLSVTPPDPPTPPQESVEVYEEDGKAVKRYPPNPAWGGGPTAKPKIKGKRKE